MAISETVATTLALTRKRLTDASPDDWRAFCCGDIQALCEAVVELEEINEQLEKLVNRKLKGKKK